MTAHRTVRLVLSLLAGLLLAGTVATTAQAEDGYRFWGYYQWTGGKWAFAKTGSEAVVPADGSVEGWRYAVGGAKPRVPRAAGDFTAICGPTPAESGKKRVAVVIDPGTPADSSTGQAPPAASGTCVVTDVKASGAKVLAAVSPVRIEKGLTCGIAGYPATGCGDPVTNIKVPTTDEPVQLQIGAAVGSATTPSPTAGPANQAPASNSSSTSGGAPWGGIIGLGVLVLLLAGGGFFISRRRRAGQ
jgi:MYXO-CTERM domain-containing protein